MILDFRSFTPGARKEFAHQMLLESDRMMNAYFREFYSEKNVVMEERRLSENRPGYLFGEQVNAVFYAASPYHWGSGLAPWINWGKSTWSP
jgi:predicted Zn-dependent peptidase